MDKNRQEPTQVPQVDTNRRRLTKAGLAAPAVLGLLTSRTVLAQVPWKCTISGQISGNLSGHEMETCDTLIRLSQSSLAGDYSPPDHKITITEVFPNDQVITRDYIFISGEGTNKKLTFTDTGTGASMLEMLTLPATTTTALEYAQKALVILLNAKDYSDTSQFPLTGFQAKKLFVAAATESGFSDTNPNLTWSYAEVIDYIDLFSISPS